MAEPPIKDSHGFFNLPQHPEQDCYDYYTYGTPAQGAGQYAHPKLLSLLNLVEHRLQGWTIAKSESEISAWPVA